MKLTLLVPFGLKGDKLYEPTQVNNGKTCGCVCPACKNPLVAKQNANTPHFAHAQTENCSRNLETTVHLAVKQIIAEKMKIRLPAVVWNNPHPRNKESKILHIEQTITLESVALEQTVGDLKPDIIIVANGKKYFIEVAVTHFIDEKKQQKINRRKISTFEIDVSGLKNSLTFPELERALFDSVFYQAEWKYHPSLEQQDQQAKQAEEQMAAEIRKAAEERQRRFEKYRNLPPDRKLEINLKSVELSKRQMNALSVFVPWDTSFGAPRVVWQSAVLAYLANVQEEDGFDELFTNIVNINDCLDWLEKVFAIKPQVKDGQKIALWKYFQHLEKLKILDKFQYEEFAIISHKSKWASLVGL